MEFRNSGHRGAMACAPENTMASFRLAVERGANEIELDLRRSADGVLVVMHDDTVDRTTDGTGRVAGLTCAQLRKLDAGDAEPVPTFDEVLAGTDVPIQVEVKDAGAVEPLLRLLAGHPELRERLSPCSFDADVVAMLTERLPAPVVVGLTSKPASLDVVRRAAALGARRVLLGWSGLDEALVAQAHGLGLHVGLWPVNTAEQFRQAVALGVDGITTDDPQVVSRNGYELREGALTRAGAPRA